MRLRSPIGAVPALSLAALAARAEGPVADPGPVRISYEQRSWITAGSAGGRGEHLVLGAVLVADWTVKSADEKRLVLAAKVQDATLECSRDRDPISDSDVNGGEGCSVAARSGELEVIVTRAGASLAGDMLTFLRGARILKPGNRRATSVPAYALEPFRVAVTTAAFEAFAHLLPPARAVPGEMRRLEVRTQSGPAGTFEISFAPQAPWETGELRWASGTSRFTPPRAKTVDLPDRPVRLTWSHRGRRRDEWLAKLEHPGSNPVPTTYDSRRRVVVEARFSARWLGEDTAGPEAALERVQLAPGQRFLVELSSEEELRARAAGSASRTWHEANGLLALALVEAAPPPGKVRFEGLFLAGKLREATVAGVSEARTLDPASLQVVPSLAGVQVGVLEGPDGVAVAIDDATWGRALAGGTAAKDPRRAATLRTALSRAATACLKSALAEIDSPVPLWSAPLVDARDENSGEVSLSADLASPKSSRHLLEGRQVESTTYRLEATWPRRLGPASTQGGESGSSLSRAIGALLPVPVEASLRVLLEARDAKAPPTALPSVSVRVDARFKARQIAGPRYRPLPPSPAQAAPAASAPAPAPPPPDTSPLPPPELAADAPPAVQAKVEAIFADLPAGQEGVGTALERYDRLEAEEPRSHAAAAAHAEIVLRLRDRIDAAALPALARHLEPSSAFAVRVLAMRLVAHALELDDAKRAAALAPLLADLDRYTVLLAGHFLGSVRHPASVEALMGALQRLEEKVEPGAQSRSRTGSSDCRSPATSTASSARARTGPPPRAFATSGNGAG